MTASTLDAWISEISGIPAGRIEVAVVDVDDYYEDSALVGPLGDPNFRHRIETNLDEFWEDQSRLEEGNLGQLVSLRNIRRILDTTPEALREARRLRISLVPIPTNSSHLNPIETHFRSIREIALSGTDFREWRTLGSAIQGAMRELNARHSAPAHKVKRCLWVRH